VPLTFCWGNYLHKKVKFILINPLSAYLTSLVLDHMVSWYRIPQYASWLLRKLQTVCILSLQLIWLQTYGAALGQLPRLCTLLRFLFIARSVSTFCIATSMADCHSCEKCCTRFCAELCACVLIVVCCNVPAGRWAAVWYILIHYVVCLE
jgi:hypothetical protein